MAHQNRTKAEANTFATSTKIERIVAADSHLCAGRAQETAQETPGKTGLNCNEETLKRKDDRQQRSRSLARLSQ
jgi:hypothetical protein